MLRCHIYVCSYRKEIIHSTMKYLKDQLSVFYLGILYYTLAYSSNHSWQCTVLCTSTPGIESQSSLCLLDVSLKKNSYRQSYIPCMTSNDAKKEGTHNLLFKLEMSQHCNKLQHFEKLNLEAASKLTPENYVACPMLLFLNIFNRDR